MCVEAKKRINARAMLRKKCLNEIMSLYSYFSNLFFFDLNSRNGIQIPDVCHTVGDFSRSY